MKKALTVQETAEVLGLSGKTIRKWANERRITSIKIGKKSLRIPMDEVERLLTENRREAITI